MNSLVVVGLNHRLAPIEVRERVAFRPGEMESAYRLLLSESGASEACILSTCNRVEVYAAANENSSNPRLLEFLARFKEMPVDTLLPLCYRHEGLDAARHLFRVTASLDSMVVGETQILGQVREAYAGARGHAATGRRLTTLFETSLGVARRVHGHTDILSGRVSISSVAVDFAQRVFGNLAGRRVLIVGGGTMAEQTLAHLTAGGVTDVQVTSRTRDTALRLASRVGGSVVGFDAIADALVQVDIVVSQTSAPFPVIGADLVRPAARKRHGKPLFMIDIAVPRDVEAGAGDIENVYLYNIDDLQQVVQRTLAERVKEMAPALAIIENEVEKLAAAARTRDADPLIRQLRTRLEDQAAEELARTLRKMNGLSDEQRKHVEQLAHRITRKFMYPPVHALKEHMQDGAHSEAVSWFQRLFGL